MAITTNKTTLAKTQIDQAALASEKFISKTIEPRSYKKNVSQDKQRRRGESGERENSEKGEEKWSL